MVAMPTSFPSGHELSPDELGALLPRYVRKPGDETINNVSVLQDDNDLLLAVDASVTYELHCVVFYNSGSTPDIKFGWSAPAGSTMTWVSVDPFNSTITAKKTVTDVVAIGTTGSNESAEFIGTLTTSTTPGQLILQWAQNGATASDTKVLTDSYLILRRVA